MLVDASNFFPWKAKLDITLEEHDVLEYVEGEIKEPTENSNVAIKVRFKKREVKAKKIILDSLGDHLVEETIIPQGTKGMIIMQVRLNHSTFLFFLFLSLKKMTQHYSGQVRSSNQIK